MKFLSQKKQQAKELSPRGTKPAAMPLMLALEPRVMFDAAVVASIAEASHADSSTSLPVKSDVADHVVASSGDTLSPAVTSAHDHADGGANPAGHVSAGQAREIAFVEGNLANLQQLLAGIPAGVEVVVLDAQQDGLAQMAAYLQGRHDITAIHILSHGSEGRIVLGNSTLDSLTLAEHATDLQTLAGSLSADGDILLYGCDVALGSDGMQFIGQLAAVTGADIAASDDVTGASLKGGNWVLEKTVGTIDSRAMEISAYAELLPSIAGTVNVTGQADYTDYGAKLTDGEGGTSDVSGVVYEIFFADSSNTPTGTVASFNWPVSGSTLINNDLGTQQGAAEFVIQTQGGTAFKLTSFVIADPIADGGNGASWTATAYKGGSTLGTQSITVTQSGTYTATVTLNSSFQDVDKVIITKSGGGDPGVIWEGFNNFVFADPVGANSAPTIGNLGGDSVAWAGVGSTVLLDSGSNATPADSELGALNGGNGNWSGASLTAQRSGTAITSDVLGFDTSGASFTVSGSNLQSGGLTFATYTSTNGVLTINFTSSGTAATTALVQDVARHISYRNDTPAGDATVRFTLSDGASSTTADVTVTSDTIYVTNTSDTATIDRTNGVSFSEAVAIAAADSTGSQTLVLSSTLASQMVTLAGNLSIGESLTVDADAASGVSLSGSTITIGSGSSLSLSNGSGDTATIASTLAGAGSLAKTGAGTLVLSSTSNSAGMTGAISVTGGTLKADTSSRLTTGTLTLDGGTLAMTVTGSAGTSTTVSNAVVLGAGGGTIDIGGGSGANIADFSGIISGSGTLTKTAAAILQLSGSNTYTGATTVSAGTLIANNSNALGTTAGATTVSSGATVRIAGGLTVGESFTISGTGKQVSSIDYGALHLISGSSTVTGAVTLAVDANVSAASGSTLTLSGVVDGSSALNKTDAGTLTLSGTNTYTGATTVSAGTLAVSGGSAIVDSSALTVSSGATFQLSASETVGSLAGAGNVTLGANTLTAGGNNTSTTFSGALSGSGGVTKAGSGTLTLSGANTYSGTTTVSAGTLAVSGGSAIADSGAMTISSGANFQLSANETIGSLAGAGTVALGSSTLTTGGNNADTTFTGEINGTGGLNKAGTGLMTLSASNGGTAWSTTLSAGRLLINGNTAIGTGAINFAGGYLWVRSPTATSVFSNAITVSADSTLDINSQGTGTTVTLTGAISGSGKLTKTGPDDLILAGTSTHTGAIQVVQGKLVAAGGSAIGDSSAVTLDFYTTLELAASETIGSLIQTTPASFDDTDSTVSLGANTLTVGGDSTSTTYAGLITGTGGVTKIGSGTLTLSGTNTYTGATTVSAGGLTVSGGAAIADSSAATVASGATLTLSSAEAIGSLAGSGNVALGANTLAAGGNNTSTTFSGVLSGTGGMTKTGTGTLTLSGTNTYTGSSSVSAGTLAVTGALSGTSGVTVSSGATLSGTGSIFATSSTNTLTVNSGGTLSPGSGGGGTLTVNGNLLVSSGGTLAVDVAGTAAGSGYDVVDVKGTVGVSGATLSVTHSYTPGNGDAYTIISNDGSDAVTGSFSGLAEGNTQTAGGNGTVLTASYIGGTGNDVTLTVSDTTAPTVSSASSSTANGRYKAGDVIAVTVTFSEAVTVTGTPQLTLETGSTDRVVNYASGSGSTTLTFNYTVQAGDSSTDLDYLSTAALALNGGTLQDAAGNNATLTLASPGAANSLGANQA
ncbi:MAG: DUF4347 domain-containing protein, partial [Pseudogulbenkiania sp.]|nr:DUF4347 domain-containing protein [Pseudogulbenkiania sp.]